MATITRTIAQHEYRVGQLIVEMGNAKVEPLPDIVSFDTLTEKAIIKSLIEEYGEGKYLVIEHSATENLYEMSIDTFVKYASIIPARPKQEKLY